MSPKPYATHPPTDATPLFEAFRWRYGSCLLMASVSHLGVFQKLGSGPLSDALFRERLGLEERPFQVLCTGLLAMGLIQRNAQGALEITTLAREHLLPESPYFVGDYMGLAAESAEVIDLVERLRSNRPADIDQQGHAFIYRDGIPSAMEASQWARHFTLSLAGRARNVAPALAETLHIDGVRHLVDVAGGTGIYSLALLEKNPSLEITLIDLPEVLKVASEVIGDHPERHRLHLQEADMFQWTSQQPFEACLFSNVFHDWDIPQCQTLIRHFTDQLDPGGRLIIHDVFLNDALSGPLAIALYSVALFTLTEGRVYSAHEYQQWLMKAGCHAEPVLPTAIHCGVLQARKSAPV